MTILPTGQQFLIESGRYAAVVTEVGATLRSFTVDGAETLHTFAEDQPAGSKGRQLVPWPNRIRDGRYVYEGVTRQLPITEIDRNTALHGLAAGAAWDLVRHTADEVVLSTVIYPQQGWDWVLEVTIGHRVDDDGLAVTVEAKNLGAGTAPYGYGTHPYVTADLAVTRLTLPFAEELLVDPERLLPIEVAPVTPQHDFREPRLVGDTFFDTALTGAPAGWEIVVETGDRTIAFWADETLPWGQVYTTPERDAIAIEPMTCGPDAFNEGPTRAGLITLEPGASTRSVWGIRAS
ncbi:MAG: aldose epimerase [Arachnia sp.]